MGEVANRDLDRSVSATSLIQRHQWVPRAPPLAGFQGAGPLGGVRGNAPALTGFKRLSWATGRSPLRKPDSSCTFPEKFSPRESLFCLFAKAPTRGERSAQRPPVLERRRRTQPGGVVPN